MREIKLRWEGQSILFDSCGEVGEQLHTFPLLVREGSTEKWKHSLQRDRDREPIRLLKKWSNPKNTDFNSFSELKKIDSAQLEIQHDEHFQIRFSLINPCVASVEFTNLTTDETPYLCVEIVCEDWIIEQLHGQSVPVTSLQSLSKPAPSVELSVTEEKIEEGLGATGDSVKCLKIQPTYNSGPAAFQSSHAYKKEEVVSGFFNRSQLTKPKSGSDLYQKELLVIADFHDNNAELKHRNRKEVINLEFFIYENAFGDASIPLSQKIEALFLPLIYNPATTQIYPYPAGKSSADIHLPKQNEELKMPSLFFEKFLWNWESQVDAVRIRPQTVSVPMEQNDFFYGVIEDFRYELDQFSESGKPLRARINLSVLGMRELNVA